MKHGFKRIINGGDGSVMFLAAARHPLPLRILSRLCEFKIGLLLREAREQAGVSKKSWRGSRRQRKIRH